MYAWLGVKGAIEWADLARRWHGLFKRVERSSWYTLIAVLGALVFSLSSGSEWARYLAATVGSVVSMIFLGWGIRYIVAVNELWTVRPTVVLGVVPSQYRNTRHGRF